MISKTVEIPSLGMTFDANQVQSTEVDVNYQDHYIDNYCVRPTVDDYMYIIRFKNGATLEFRNAKLIYRTKVELVEGKLYHMGRDNKKWLALCRYDEEFGELTLFPTTRRKYAPLVKNSDRMQYQFFEELEPDLKKYL